MLATANVNTYPRQPAVIGNDPGTYADDSILVAYDPSGASAGALIFSSDLATSRVVSISSPLRHSGSTTASQRDDTVWMTEETGVLGARISSVNGTTGTVTQITPTVAGATLRDFAGLVVADDTLYVGYQTTGSCGTVQAGVMRVSIRDPQVASPVFNGLSSADTQPGQLAKTGSDDTLVLSTYNCGTTTPPKELLVANPKLNAALIRPMPWYSLGAAAGDDSIYVSQFGGNGLAAMNPEALDDSRITSVTGAGGFGRISVWPGGNSGDDTVFLPDGTNQALWMVNGRTLLADDSVALSAAPSSVTVARPNLAYVSQSWAGSTLWAVGIVSGASSPSTGVQDDSITINLTLPQLFTQNADLVTDVWLDGSVTPMAALVRQGNTISAKVPPGSGGPYSVIVGLNGGNRIKVGEFTYNSPNPPAPPAPPAPAMTPISQVINGVVGTAIPPTSRFTLENFSLVPRYSVYPALPHGLTIDPATGVVSGTPTVVYPSTRHWITASAGGNSESASSTLQVTISPAPAPPPPPPVTRSLVLNQGERTRGTGSIHDRITTTGSSTGIEPGTRLTPYIRYSGQTAFSEGRATIVVQADGTFRWTREIRRNRDVTGYVAFEDLTSNQVTWVGLK